MANVLHRTQGNTGSYPYKKDYRASVDTPQYDSADWIINPDLSAVEGFNSIYWDISGDSVTLANQATRDARDADILSKRIQVQVDAAKEELDADHRLILKAIVQLVVDELNILRAEHALTPRTYAQARTAIHTLLDGEV